MMSFLGFFMRNLNSKIILMRVLIIFMLLAITLPVEKYDVIAQEPDNPQTVYLPLVVKNSMSTCADGPDQWLCLFNQYRITSGLNPVTSNSSYNYGSGLHTNYLLNCPAQASVNMHEETVCSGWTTEGRTAGSQSNMVWNGGPNFSVKQSVDIWMQFGRHRYGMLHPDLNQSGFNLSCDSKNCAAGLNVLAGLQPLKNLRDVVYPAENQINFPRSGFPITRGFYSADTVGSIVAATIVLYDSFSNPVQGTITIYNDYVKEVVFTPTYELLPNHTYRMVMNVTIGGILHSRSWYFTTNL